jgi:hypothetical protein
MTPDPADLIGWRPTQSPCDKLPDWYTDGPPAIYIPLGLYDFDPRNPPNERFFLAIYPDRIHTIATAARHSDLPILDTNLQPLQEPPVLIGYDQDAHPTWSAAALIDAQATEFVPPQGGWGATSFASPMGNNPLSVCSQPHSGMALSLPNQQDNPTAGWVEDRWYETLQGEVSWDCLAWPDAQNWNFDDFPPLTIGLNRYSPVSFRATALGTLHPYLYLTKDP